MRQRQRVGGAFRDLSMFGLLRTEWRRSIGSVQTRLAAPVEHETVAG
jgi:hypothetical protein